MSGLQDKMLVRVETAREETLHIREFDYGVPNCCLVPEASHLFEMDARVLGLQRTGAQYMQCIAC
jgi:hypothetical protein